MAAMTAAEETEVGGTGAAARAAAAWAVTGHFFDWPATCSRAFTHVSGCGASLLIDPIGSTPDIRSWMANVSEGADVTFVGVILTGFPEGRLS